MEFDLKLNRMVSTVLLSMAVITFFFDGMLSASILTVASALFSIASAVLRTKYAPKNQNEGQDRDHE
jgi:hypothetical protein